MQQFATLRPSSTGGLSRRPSLASNNGVSPRAVDSTTHPARQALALLLRQLDVSNPEADRRARDTQQRGELLNRAALLPPKLPRPFTFYRFHTRQQSGNVGRSGRRG